MFGGGCYHVSTELANAEEEAEAGTEEESAGAKQKRMREEEFPAMGSEEAGPPTSDASAKMLPAQIEGVRFDQTVEFDDGSTGETNGMELGDPCCEWRPGEEPFRKCLRS